MNTDPGQPGPASKSPLELTLKAIVLGVILSAILAAANAYLGLRVGMTVSASIPAAVVSMGVLRMFKRRGILENNIVQTAGSAGESLAAGVIFTLPALVIMGFWEDFNYWWVTLIAGFGGLLGVLFTIPLRRALIVDKPLKFPEGQATAEVLKAGEAGGAGVKLIALAAVAGGLFKLLSTGMKLFGGVLQGAMRIGSNARASLVYGGMDLSPALLSVGYIVGLNIAVLIFIGGAANWLVAIPITAMLQDWPVHVNTGQAMSALETASHIWSKQTRYIGVGGMLVGGLWAIWRMRKSMFSGITSGLAAYRNSRDSGQAIERTERDIPMTWVLAGTVVSAVVLFVIYQLFVGSVRVTLPMAAAMLVLGFLFSAVAAYMAGVVGSSNNPISGVTIATVAASALLLYLLMGPGAKNGPAAAIIIGSVVCCAAAIAGDNMQDLKAGYIVGATPWKQQVMQIVGTLSAALVIAPVLMLLMHAYGFKGPDSPPDSEALTAVQANLMASVANGVFLGGLPWHFVFIGMGVAAAVIIGDLILEARKATFRMPVLAVAIGIYLPVEMAVPIFIGGGIKAAIAVHQKRRGTPPEGMRISEHRGILFASGLITGEALMGIALAIPIACTGNKKILAIADSPWGAWPGLVLLVGVAAWLASVASRTRNSD
ncbi:MAG: oligopeptide transporter, OPT family [Phycisphaerae bacterium]|jgi:putative OPT family oligopeptide transporter|nr:oligopeptide transporter, OPT family [Phycisphaerae bacterium]